MASGSNKFEAMVVVPCSTATLGRLAHDIADNLTTRAGEVFLKERRKLILVPRETPLSLIQIKNMELLTLAGAHVIPATPSFYGNPKSIEDLVDTVIARVYDHAGYPGRGFQTSGGKKKKSKKIKINHHAKQVHRERHLILKFNVFVFFLVILLCLVVKMGFVLFEKLKNYLQPSRFYPIRYSPCPLPWLAC